MNFLYRDAIYKIAIYLTDPVDLACFRACCQHVWKHLCTHPLFLQWKNMHPVTRLQTAICKGHERLIHMGVNRVHLNNHEVLRCFKSAVLNQRLEWVDYFKERCSNLPYAWKLSCEAACALNKLDVVQYCLSHLNGDFNLIWYKRWMCHAAERNFIELTLWINGQKFK